MVIRNVQAPKIAKDQKVSDVAAARAEAVAAEAQALRALTDLVDRALVDGNLSQGESKKLDAALAQHPKLKAAVADHLTQALEKAAGEGKQVSISEMALSQVSRSLGVDFKELFFRRQARSQTVDHDVAGGLEKTAKSMADEHSAEKHKAASDARLQSQKAILDSKRGVVDRPVGGSKGAAWDAAQVLAQDLASRAEGKLDEKLSVEAKAAKDVLREPLVRTGNAVMTEVMKNPDTMKALGDVGQAIGTPAWKEALSAACSNVGKDIVSATNMTAVNTEAVQAFVSGAASGATRLTKLAQGLNNPALEAAVAKHAPKAAEGIAAVGAKLTQGAATAGKTVAQTATQTAGAAAATSQAAAGTAQAAGATAQTAAQTGAQATPVVGQALGVVTTGLAAAEFVGQCGHKPRDWKRIMSAGLNVVGQAVGIFLPFVGAATTATKLAADAAMNANDRKHGRETAPGFSLGDVAPHLTNASGLAATFLEGAGHGEAAGKIKAYSSKLELLAHKGLSSTELASLPAAEREALMQTLAACQGETEKLAAEAKGTPHEAAALLLGEAYRGLLGVWRKSKNVDGAENPEAERKKVAGEAMEAAAKAATASAIVDAADGAGKKAV